MEYGIFVNDSTGIKYSIAIVQGYKTVETRNRNTLKQLVGKRVNVIQTGKGKAKVIGSVKIVSAMHCKQSDFQKYNGLHCVPIGSKYDAGSNGKWLYFLEDPQTVFPYELPANVIRHGFSYCEWEAEQ